MNNIIEPPVINQHHFSSFEVFSSVVSGYDMDIKQIDRGLFSAYMQQTQCGSVFINRFTTTRRLEVNGKPPPGVRTFGIPTANCQPFVWRHQHSPGNTIQVYKPCTELAVVTSVKFESMDVSISEDDFNALNHQWGFPDLDKMVGRSEMVECDPAAMHRLRKMLKHICQVVETHPDELKQNIALQNLVKYEVPYLLAQALMSSETQNGKAMPSKRNYAVKTAIDYIQSTSDEAISINKFCQETGINERTLQRAFLDLYNVTPKAYIQAFRLNNAYKKLLNSDPDTSRITEIASSLGYWHLSQFATDYHRQFGELPSKTLRTVHTD